MDTFTATMLAEGVFEAEDQEELLEAWQVLVDTGLAWKLQGCFGRTARDLLAEGLIQPFPRPAAASVDAEVAP